MITEVVKCSESESSKDMSCNKIKTSTKLNYLLRFRGKEKHLLIHFF
jgi:hypothetical protein